MARLEQHRIRARPRSASPYRSFERLHDGGDQVGATADRLGEDDIGTLLRFQLADLVDQVVEPAAEAGAGDFLDGEALRAQAVRIDQILRPDRW